MQDLTTCTMSKRPVWFEQGFSLPGPAFSGLAHKDCSDEQGPIGDEFWHTKESYHHPGQNQRTLLAGISQHNPAPFQKRVSSRLLGTDCDITRPSQWTVLHSIGRLYGIIEVGIRGVGVFRAAFQPGFKGKPKRNHPFGGGGGACILIPEEKTMIPPSLQCLGLLQRFSPGPFGQLQSRPPPEAQGR